eukprot:scaffold58137_cov35-Tisochrysis_lutea.AAC.3
MRMVTFGEHVRAKHFSKRHKVAQAQAVDAMVVKAATAEHKMGSRRCGSHLAQHAGAHRAPSGSRGNEAATLNYMPLYLLNHIQLNKTAMALPGVGDAIELVLRRNMVSSGETLTAELTTAALELSCGNAHNVQ